MAEYGTRSPGIFGILLHPCYWTLCNILEYGARPDGPAPV